VQVHVQQGGIDALGARHRRERVGHAADRAQHLHAAVHQQVVEHAGDGAFVFHHQDAEAGQFAHGPP
jgi:hypothetical protein